MSHPAPSGRPLGPRVLTPLALGTFAIGTGSFVFAGLLGAVAGDLSVSAGTAGQLITAYAVAYALLSPVIVTLANRVPRRRLLIASLALFTVANAAAVVLPSYGTLMVSRLVAAAGGAAFTPTAVAVAAQLAPPESRGRALAPFQQYRLVETLPGQANVLLSLNASAIYLGQGAGAGVGALVLLYGSTSTLGWVAALCALPGFLLLLPQRARPVAETQRGAG